MPNLTGPGRQIVLLLYAGAMISLIVGVDVAFFRRHVLERLASNIGIVLIFGAFYFRFLRAP
jgi:hypothetical protein